MNATSLGADARTHQIVQDLFWEQDVDLLAVNYKHGVLRMLFVLLRSLVFSRRSELCADARVASHKSIAVVFFQNEDHAISNAREWVEIDHIMRLNARSLTIVREQLGWAEMWRQTLRFVRLAAALKGWRHVGRFTYPLLGWLLYRSFYSLLDGKRDVTVITTNMHHPLSIGVVWAAVCAGQPADFYEHATTPRAFVRDRGYRHVYVNFQHTRHILVNAGFKSDNVHVLQRMHSFPKRTMDHEIRHVGICINFFDSLESIDTITRVLRERGSAVSYRVHDADPRLAQLKRLAAEHATGWSDARQSRIEVFLDTVDLIVAGNSNVIADALMAGRQVIYYWSGAPDMFDYYGLVGYYALPHASDAASLRAVMAQLDRAVATC